MNPEKLEWTERLLLRSMGAYGYLKIPRAFTEKFKYNKNAVEDPQAFLSETKDEVRLTYVWRKDGERLANLPPEVQAKIAQQTQDNK